MKTIHLIQHTHWDREWYFTENDSKALLYYFMDDLMSRMESDKTIGPFILDAQTVMLDDYFEVAPENKNRLEKLIKSRRILIGPWYTQTDFLTVSAESIARNLLLGLADCRRMGETLEVGYVPDSFGQMAQLPMLLTQFNINKAVIWRGWSERLVANTEFTWQSQDGSEVTTAVFPWGYGCAKWLPTDKNVITDAIVERARKQCQFAATQSVMLPNGNDQSPFEYQIPGLLDHVNQSQDEFHFVNSSFDNYFKSLEHEQDKLPRFSGEMLDPKYMRIHRGIFSTRMDIKLANARLEQLLSRHLEPLAALNFANGLPYPQSAINSIWRSAMKSHAHDSIGGCNSDRVNVMVLNRLESGIEMAEQLLELNFRKLAEGIEAQVDGTKVVVFNSVPKLRDSLVELTIYTAADTIAFVDGTGSLLPYQIVHESQQDMSTIIQELSNDTTTTWYRKLVLAVELKAIPACGYTTIYLQEGMGVCSQATTSPSDTKHIANQWFDIEHLADNSISLIDRRNGHQYHNVFELTDGSDQGDNYNFSPLADDWIISNRECEHFVTTVQGELFSSLTVAFEFSLPADLNERQQGITSVKLPVSLHLTLRNDRPSIDVKVELDNTVCDHRIQMHFPTGIVKETHFADQPFGLIERQTIPQELELWEQEGWTEAPIANYPMQSMVLQRDDERGLGIVTKGLREYEIDRAKPQVLAITLMRSVGWLGQPNLTYRPGRASGMVLPSPDSQIQGEHCFELSLVPFDMGNEESFWRTIEMINTPVIAHVGTDWARFRLNKQDTHFPASQSLLSWESSLHFSTLKKAEESDALILRAYNPTPTVQIVGELNCKYETRRVQLDETTPVLSSDKTPFSDKVQPSSPLSVSISVLADSDH
ncbi:alpha-mannosidase [Vibrio sinensis]|uniref:Alpha-mannosidase n=1 Tax=Vibrio sinensis TaxID=2302434 RepID=A0A3A6QSC1_9VIBR|nr:glycoside hydrolase family 38 C-terminal domain-containing protein [Vibrio sinensis]RJX75273.1 alpha-mannosidase [Vibrio sinensis]